MAAKKSTAKPKPTRKRKRVNKDPGRRERQRQAAALQLRIDEARTLWCAGFTTKRIKAVLESKHKVSARTATDDMRRMFAQIDREAAAAPDTGSAAWRERGEAMLSESFHLAKARRDPKAMTLAAERLVQLGTGTAPFGPNRHEVTGRDGGPVQTQAKVVLMPPLDAPLTNQTSTPPDERVNQSRAILGASRKD